MKKTDILSSEFKKQLISEGIDPINILSFTSKYNKKDDVIITSIKMEDGTTHSIVSETSWYASRKDKKW